MPVIAIIALEDIVSFLETMPDLEPELKRIKDYQAQYGIKTPLGV